MQRDNVQICWLSIIYTRFQAQAWWTLFLSTLSTLPNTPPSPSSTRPNLLLSILFSFLIFLFLTHYSTKNSTTKNQISTIPFPRGHPSPLSPSITQSIQLKKNKNKIERRLSPFYTLQLNIHSNMPCFKLNGEWSDNHGIQPWTHRTIISFHVDCG